MSTLPTVVMAPVAEIRSHVTFVVIPLPTTAPGAVLGDLLDAVVAGQAIAFGRAVADGADPRGFARAVAERVGGVDEPAEIDDPEQHDREDREDHGELGERLPSRPPATPDHRVTVIVELCATQVKACRDWVTTVALG